MTNVTKLVLCLSICFSISPFTSILVAQSNIDECSQALNIGNPLNYCSGDGEFNNNGATPSGFGNPPCWTNVGKDVWFKFTALATSVNIVVNGQDGNSNLSSPQAALYSGSCNGTISEIICANSSNDVLNMSRTGLIVGQIYLIRISSSNNTEEGSFSLCINNFNPPVTPGQDCNTGAILCDTSSFVVQALSGSGQQSNEGNGSCLSPGFGASSENQSTWLKWTAATSGTFTFIINPLRASDDLDFAVYELTDINACGARTLLRCVATACKGPTGLNLTATDVTEDFNCDRGEDGFVKALDMEAGKHYGLLINNFTSSGVGFEISFGGSGQIDGPQPDFTISPASGLRCDQDFTITSTSGAFNGSIVDYEWVFGERAVPATADSKGPHMINYESFGQKYIVLTVTSDKGCKVTKIKPLYAEPCCDDIDMINISITEQKDPLCFYSTDGVFNAIATGTNGEFMYSLNSGDAFDKGQFNKLAEGNYKIKVVDLKGCADSVTAILSLPDVFSADAGSDQSIDLGDTTLISGTVTPSGNYDVSWRPGVGVFDSLEYSTDVVPPGTTTYTFVVKNENGCEVNDQVTIKTSILKEITAPNIFSPFSSAGLNDYFNISAGRSISNIEDMRIFDRWGNMVYNGKNIKKNNYSTGWDGTCNGREVAEGVYAWIAKVKYLDNTTEYFSGDITIVK